MNSTKPAQHTFDVAVVGGGVAGVGVAVALRHAGIHNFIVLERHQVGASFAAWPKETRFITPSFPSNSAGILDLNSPTIGVSPGYSLEVEHPTGQEFARHLRAVAGHFKLPVQEQVDVSQVSRDDGGFIVHTALGILRANHVIWAAGEFQYPQRRGFPGSELCRHTATIDSYEDLEGNDFIIIGGYESGVDAAYHLASRGKFVRVFDSVCPWANTSAEPSTALSPFTLERLHEDWFQEQVELIANTPITSVACAGGHYEVIARDGARYQTDVPPLWAGGFEGSHRLIEPLFQMREDGYPLLTANDESTVTPGLFLCGPSVRHENHVFCFIYKYRQRFAVVAKTIATSLGLPAEGLETYRTWGMYLDDLSCCGEECVC
ncbi:MAG: NAD(P)/FAD-dependent oxidoreductase [Pseudomonadota bacterium]